MRFEPSTPEHTDREISIRVDFDQLDLDGLVEASMRFVVGPRHPEVGDLVLMYDGVAGSCFGRVADVKGWMAWIEADWDTWTPAKGTPGPPPAVRRPPAPAPAVTA